MTNQLEKRATKTLTDLRRGLARISDPHSALDVATNANRAKQAFAAIGLSVEECNKFASVYLHAYWKFGYFVHGIKRGGQPLNNNRRRDRRRIDTLSIPGTKEQRRYGRRLTTTASEADIDEYLKVATPQLQIASIDGCLNWLEGIRPPVPRARQQIPEGVYSVLYADPPWRYSNSGFEQSAASQYPTLDTASIGALTLPKLAADSTLFIWATSPLLPEALQVMAAWAFEYKACMIWVKDRAPGMGWFLNTKHELLLLGTRGESHPDVKVDSVVSAPVQAHSQKPDEFYNLIEAMYPDGRYVELFARRPREGWAQWGNEDISRAASK